MRITVVDQPDVSSTPSSYPANKPPLARSSLIKLPLGSVRAHGWLRHQLDLMVEGMTGRLSQLSGFLRDDNGWFGGESEGWEEQPYWLRGFYPLAVLTGDERCIDIANRWIDAVLDSQDAEGYFGAVYHRRITGKDGGVLCDLWPHMVMLDAVIQHHEYTGDNRVIPFMTRFFAFCRDLPDNQFIPTYCWKDRASYGENFGDWKPTIQHKRAGDMLPHLYWLYNHTQDPWLLDLARRFFGHIEPAEDEWLDHHIVHFTQRFQYPGVYSALSHDPGHLALTDYWYDRHMGTWGQQPRGIFGADERIRPGKVDPRQGFETCGMVEFAKSFYLLGRITGDPVYADRCEDVMLNHFPAAYTPDLKGLHYLTASNQPQLDASENHDYYNKGRQICYSPHIYRCCQHNVAMGWPWWVQNLWQATGDNGLAVWMYANAEVTARAGDTARDVSIRLDTDYPFDTKSHLSLQTTEPVAFPLYLRVPRWCHGFAVSINDERQAIDAPPQSYVRIERIWSDGDTVDIEMPEEISLTRWPRNGSVTVDRGPLSYSVRIEEDWRRCGGTDEWPEWEVFPSTTWNYGLVLPDEGQEQIFERLTQNTGTHEPWRLFNAPVRLRTKARRIRGWTLEDETVQPLRPGPIRSIEPDETIILIPLGCARLRMSCLPVIGEDPEAREWTEG